MSRPALRAQLNTFLAGDAETGCGGRMTERKFIEFIRMCPEMRLICLDAALHFGKDVLLAIVESCPKLEALRISGHDKSDSKALGALATACEANPQLGRNLRDLFLIDQPTYSSEKPIKKPAHRFLFE
ncbi:hypothetical protein GYMLUDRAFT_77393 [Collybiopsis luxurians FD-317 M1]|uniref:Uncharacterized protein n=1 Tax=Collybiopsis luxurians FD-317 M1 TaxID=944289 RepID=A0A0D0ATI4_9AGAR|nr:hypothetical protein GYMLUDRAFT_77393 [Collybiopsis luxurians FD-317 M1]